MFDRIKRFYELGLRTEEMVRNAMEKGVITEAEYKTITATE